MNILYPLEKVKRWPIEELDGKILLINLLLRRRRDAM